MKNQLRFVRSRLSIMRWSVCLSFVWMGMGEATREQTLDLRAGWNAVFLEVQPEETDPAILLAGAPVDIVATHYASEAHSQFVTDPSADLHGQAGWGVWYAPGRPDAFLSTLHTLYGQRAYLVHAQTDHVWTVKGAVLFDELRWQADAFNLVGFGVVRRAGPTFAQFFRGSAAHRHNRIYRLVEGAWRRVMDPDAQTLRSGEAFWIYCDGGSQYQGPLRVETPSRVGLILQSAPADLVLRNTTDHPIIPIVEQVTGDNRRLPLSIVIQSVGDETEPSRSVAAPQPEAGWQHLLPPLEAGAAIRVPLEARLEDMTAARQSSLLKVSTDLGTEVWVPVHGVRRDLEER